MLTPQQNFRPLERDVLTLVAQFYSYRTIADRLDISLKEVLEIEIASMERLGLKDRIDVLDYVATLNRNLQHWDTTQPSSFQPRAMR
jgi:DNA-binding NarL/FixJ family response regulator